MTVSHGHYVNASHIRTIGERRFRRRSVTALAECGVGRKH